MSSVLLSPPASVQQCTDINLASSLWADYRGQCASGERSAPAMIDIPFYRKREDLLSRFTEKERIEFTFNEK